MFLDLTSTLVGGVLVLVGEGVLLVVVMVWALMDVMTAAYMSGKDKKYVLPWGNGTLKLLKGK